MNIGGCLSLFNFRDKRRDSVFVGLKETNHVAAHQDIFSRSVFKFLAAVKGFSTIIKRPVSSANRRILDPMS